MDPVAEVVARNARPIYVHVPGAPRQPGDRVTIGEPSDWAGYPELVGREGVVVYLEYECGCGQSYPNDPMIGVRVGDRIVELWAEELRAS